MPNGTDIKKKRDDNILMEGVDTPNTALNTPLPVLPASANNSSAANSAAAAAGTTTAGGNGTAGGRASADASAPAASTGAAPAPGGSNKARPKRVRTKSEKKDEQENTSRFHCDFCGRDLSTAIRARCAVCPDYDSCLDCFSVGAALNPHKPEHAYRLIEVVHTPIFQIGWSADEEEKLLEGLELYGVGNWEQVAKLIGTKNPLETEQHFMKVFLQPSTAPLPDPTRMVPSDKVPLSEKYDDVDPKALRVMHMHQQEDAAGWMEKRQDFVYEWDNEAEDIIGDMELGDDDSKAERDLKAQVLEIYAGKLNERARRKEFVLERGLTNFKDYQATEKKRSKEERELREKLRVFMRFVPQADMEKFIKGIMEERALRARIETYREGRALGAKTVEECERLASSQGSRTKARLSLPAADSAGSSQRRNRRVNGEGSASEGTGCAVNGNVPVNSTDSKDRKGTILGDVDLELMPGAELLSKTEITLCCSLKITPHQYMIVKEVLIRENARTGSIRKKDAKLIVKLDSAKVSKIFDYLAGCGWIRSVANATTGTGGRSTVPNSVPPNGTRA